MFNLIIWFFVFPRLIHNIILIIVVIFIFASYKVFKVFKADHRDIIRKGRMCMTMTLKKPCKRNQTQNKSFQSVAHLSLAIVLIAWVQVTVRCDPQVSKIFLQETCLHWRYTYVTDHCRIR